MDQVEQIKTRDCLAQPPQKRIDVPLNGGALIVPIVFAPLTGRTTNICEEFIAPDGIKKYRFVKQISSFGDVKLFDYYEADTSEGPINDKFDIQFGEAYANKHNIKICYNDECKHITGLQSHTEILDARFCGKDNFYIQFKNSFGEKIWQRI